MKRETSGGYPAADLPDLHVVFSWKVNHVHCSLVSCMPLHMSPTFPFLLFLVWSVCNYQILCREDKANTVSVGPTHNCFSVSLYSSLSCQETPCLFQHLTVHPFLLLPPHLLLLFYMYSTLLILTCPSLICSFVHSLLLIFQSPLLSCPAFFSSML